MITSFQKDRECRYCDEVIKAGQLAKYHKKYPAHVKCANLKMIEDDEKHIELLRKEIETAEKS